MPVAVIMRYLLIATLAFAVAGCGGDGGGFPNGKWTTTRPKGDVWIADFGSDGTWHFSSRGAAEIEHGAGFTELTAGLYSADGDALTIKADYHCAVLARQAGLDRERFEQATYLWMLTNNGSLTFTAEDERCQDRKSVFDGVVYRPLLEPAGRPTDG